MISLENLEASVLKLSKKVSFCNSPFKTNSLRGLLMRKLRHWKPMYSNYQNKVSFLHSPFVKICTRDLSMRN